MNLQILVPSGVFVLIGFLKQILYAMQKKCVILVRKIFMTIFEFIRQLFFQNDVYKLQEEFSELEIRVFLENGFGSFQKFLILLI
jgi:hypothetical protein